MRTSRTFDEHLTLYCRYADLVQALTPRAWTRLQRRCATLDSDGLDGIIDRARLLATAQMRLPLMPNPPLAIRLIKATAQVVTTSLALTYETLTALVPSTIDSLRPRRTSTGKPRVDAYIDAGYLVDRALQPYGPYRGLVTAVRSGGQAVLHHDWIAPADFRAVYQWVETEMPYALVDPRPQHSGVHAG